MEENILKFLKRERLFTLAVLDGGNQPWMCNLYYGVDGNFNIYWVSLKNTKHSKQIYENKNVAFNIVWVNPNDLEDREAVQGTGIATEVKGIKETAIAIKSMINNIPEWTKWFKSKEFLESLTKAKIYKIKPSYIKYWNDRLLKEEHTFEMKF